MPPRMVDPGDLSRVLLSRVGSRVALRLAHRGDTPHPENGGDTPHPEHPRLDELLSQLVGSARAAWPMLDLDDGTFIRYLADRIAVEDDPREALERVHAGDLFLACACAAGDQRAISEFSRVYGAEIASVLVRMDESFSAEDVVQTLFEKHLIGDGDRPPKIAEYGGRGPLGAWLRVVAMRLALDRKRRERKYSAPSQQLVRPDILSSDPEIAYLRERYLTDFGEAFSESFDELTTRERNALRMRFVDGLNIDQIGALYNVHRATVARWIAAGRDALLEGTRRRLTQKLRLTNSEFDSLMRLVRSELDVSIKRCLAPADSSS